MKAAVLAFLALILFLPSSADARGTRFGFVAAWGSGGVDNANIRSDLVTLGESAWASFDVDPLADVTIKGARELHILRYHASCPDKVDSNCSQTLGQARTTAILHRGWLWELGNEPGISGQDDGGSGFASWERAVYAAIKGGDPTSTTLGPGVLNWDGGGWAGIPEGRAVYDGSLWGGISYDAVGLHIYPADTCMQRDWQAVALSQMDQATAQYRRVYLTETGDQSAACAVPPSPTTIQVNVRALHDRTRQDGVRMALFFLNRPGNQVLCPPSCNNALLDPDGHVRTPDGLGWAP